MSDKEFAEQQGLMADLGSAYYPGILGKENKAHIERSKED